MIDRRLYAKLVPTFEDRGCHVVSVTDPYCRILIFLDQLIPNSSINYNNFNFNSVYLTNYMDLDIS
jgi:hypothetical protein